MRMCKLVCSCLPPLPHRQQNLAARGETDLPASPPMPPPLGSFTSPSLTALANPGGCKTRAVILSPFRFVSGAQGRRQSEEKIRAVVDRAGRCNNSGRQQDQESGTCLGSHEIRSHRQAAR